MEGSHGSQGSASAPGRTIAGGGARTRSIYVGIFLIALSTLMLEILLTRITSVIAWYHLAFFVISLAMLGMTAGAVAVFLLPKLFVDERIPERLAQSALAFAATTPIAIGMAMSIPLLPIDDLMDFFALLTYGGALAIPFGLGGVCLTLALTRAGLPASTAYGVDLVGAALGCALVIPLLDRFDAASAALIAAALAGVAAACFGWARGVAGRRQVTLGGGVAVLLVSVGIMNANAEFPPLHPGWIKGAPEN